MSYKINPTQTVWLAFNQTYRIFVKVNAEWNQRVVINDPNGLIDITWIESGSVGQTLIGTVTVPSSFGDLNSYPVNVTINNDGGTNKKKWRPSMVRDFPDHKTSDIVWSFDQLNNQKQANMIVIFTSAH
uniref:hypothetical protein n=1 Tax=Roseivirga sp. TaxID=1964215 RepID=UPI00404767D6